MADMMTFSVFCFFSLCSSLFPLSSLPLLTPSFFPLSLTLSLPLCGPENNAMLQGHSGDPDESLLLEETASAEPSGTCSLVPALEFHLKQPHEQGE